MAKTPVEQLIRRNLRQAAPRKVAVHELGIFGYSQTGLSSRLREMKRIGEVDGNIRQGTRFNEWGLTPSGRDTADKEEAQQAGIAS